MTTSQFKIGDLLKLILVIAVACAIGPSTLGQHWTIVTIGCVCGIFVAEHFANSRIGEFSAMLLIPLGFASMAPLIPLVQSPEAESPTQYLTAMALGALTGIAPAALMVVAINILIAFAHRITGIRLLKYDWSGGDNAGKLEEPSDPPKDPASRFDN